MTDLKQQLTRYIDAGLSALPAIGRDKKPAIGKWKDFQERLPKLNELSLAGADGLCIICGSVSGNLELIDFDYSGELYEAWSQLVPSELLAKLVVETSQNNGVHVVYRCTESVSGNTKLAQGQRDGEQKTLIETRGEGGLFVCFPTPGYKMQAGDLARPPVLTTEERDTLLSAAFSLNEIIPEPKAERALRGDARRPGDDFNERGNTAWYLEKAGWTARHTTSEGNQHWTRPGKSEGTSATLKDKIFYVFSSNAPPFEAGQAYRPFSVYALLEHGGDYSEAAKALRREGYGETSTIGYLDEQDAKLDSLTDPGPIPEKWMRMPGFVGDVMDYTLDTAPYPSIPLAFCGAVALQAFLAGRKVMDSGGVRTNLYLLALADSGSGKNAPRNVNMKILADVGLIDRVGDSFASGQGLEDAMHLEKCILFQTDEIDTVLQSINKSKDGRAENIMSALLKMYSQAESFYPMRKKADGEARGAINQPCLILFGTAIPKHFYQSLNERMLTNGLVARMVIAESISPRVSQEAALQEVPAKIMDVAKWWTQYTPGDGNLTWENPTPIMVPSTVDAAQLLADTRELCDGEYRTCQEQSDNVGMTIWARVNEHCRKLALLYAVSENHQHPQIQLPAAEWASQFTIHQARRLLYMAGSHVAENAFDELCLKFKRTAKGAAQQPPRRSYVLRRMKVDSQTLDKIEETLIERGELRVRMLDSNGGRRPTVYELAV